MPYTNLIFAAFLTLAVEDVHLPEWSRRSEVHRLLWGLDVYREKELVGGCYNSLLSVEVHREKEAVGRVINGEVGVYR
ncbi:hypothetical protein Hanom_Chr01g00021411 [Helianthus anomalus]